jgi:hypothetical protein
VPDRYAALFRHGHSVNGFDPVGGNRGQFGHLLSHLSQSCLADYRHRPAWGKPLPARSKGGSSARIGHNAGPGVS